MGTTAEIRNNVVLFHKGKRKGDMLELYRTPLSEIPITFRKKDIQNKFVLLADKIIDGKNNNLSNLIVLLFS